MKSNLYYVQPPVSWFGRTSLGRHMDDINKIADVVSFLSIVSGDEKITVIALKRQVMLLFEATEEDLTMFELMGLDVREFDENNWSHVRIRAFHSLVQYYEISSRESIFLAGE